MPLIRSDHIQMKNVPGMVFLNRMYGYSVLQQADIQPGIISSNAIPLVQMKQLYQTIVRKKSPPDILLYT